MAFRDHKPNVMSPLYSRDKTWSRLPPTSAEKHPFADDDFFTREKENIDPDLSYLFGEFCSLETSKTVSYDEKDALTVQNGFLVPSEAVQPRQLRLSPSAESHGIRQPGADGDQPSLVRSPTEPPPRRFVTPDYASPLQTAAETATFQRAVTAPPGYSPKDVPSPSAVELTSLGCTRKTSPLSELRATSTVPVHKLDFKSAATWNLPEPKKKKVIPPPPAHYRRPVANVPVISTYKLDEYSRTLHGLSESKEKGAAERAEAILLDILNRYEARVHNVQPDGGCYNRYVSLVLVTADLVFSTTTFLTSNRLSSPCRSQRHSCIRRAGQRRKSRSHSPSHV
jgi:hypothetical protein